MTRAALAHRFARLAPIAAWLIAAALPVAAQAQDRPARFLGREEILLYGIGLKVEPSHQTVPKDIATIVSTYLQAPQLPPDVPPFAPDAVVKATLRGPSFATPLELTVSPNAPFNIPPLTVPGTHALEDVRLISGGQVLLRGAPDHATIEVIERLLITQVTARALTAAEIREKGIVFDSSNFQAYNFSAAFAIEDRLVDLSFPVLLPALAGAADVQVGSVGLPAVSVPGLPQLKTIIPDTLKLQAQIPNLTVVGFTLQAPDLKGNSFVVPPIPGVIVIPGDIGFLNQYFSVLLMVGNVAPAGSGLDVADLRAEIVLPPGRDTVVNTVDDPLRMAMTAGGESPRVQLVVQPGPDGKLGTTDDIGVLRPGDSGNAEYLVEGRREGSHVVEMEISGTLHGLPIGPVQVRGRAAGAVLVRNPKFTLTFTHPEAVAAGEPYTLDVTVTNTSESPANFVTVSLYPRNISGATIVGEPSLGIESIAPGDSATVTFDLVSRITGKVTAATLDSDDKVAGRFELKAAVGELGVPVSPDTLVLPKEAGSLPRTLRDAALGLLGKAYAVATAPAAALPRDVRRFSRKVVIDRAVEVAEAGFRHTLREPLPDSAAQLLMDFAGSNYPRLADLVRPTDLAFDQDNYVGFDELRRRSVRGDVFAQAVAGLLAPGLASQGAAPFHNAVAQKWSYRPGHVSVLVSSTGELPVSLSIVDPAGRSLGGANAGKITKDIPFSDFLPFDDAAGARVGEMALLAVPDAGAYTVRLTRRAAPDGPYTVSIVAPAGDGSLRQIVFNVNAGEVPSPQASAGDPVSFVFELVDGAGTIAGAPVSASSVQAVVDPAPSVISVIQQRSADEIRCDPAAPGYPAGRVVAVLFSEEVTPASVHDRVKAEDITGFDPEANRVVSVALQPGRRIAFVALRDPIGPFVPRQIGIDSATDLRGQPMTPFTGPMEITVGPEAGVVSGRVIRADGTPVPFANVRLFYLLECGAEPAWIGIASKTADADGRYAWDYVLRQLPDKIVAVDPETDEFRSVPFNIQRDGQRLNVDIVFLGRGTFAGTTRSETGSLLAGTNVRVTSLTDASQYGATTDAAGRFSIARIPVGNVFVEAINTTARAQFSLSEAIPFAGAIVDRDITLLDIAQQQITVKHGTVTGRVLRIDGATPAPGVPVFVWYATASQPNVLCPPMQAECAIAGGHTDASGAFSFPDVTAGSLRVSAFDQDGLVQGEARLQLAADATVDLNVLLVGGLGTVTGRVLAPDGTPVPGAAVGGGLSLVTTNTSGEFTLTDVPVGKREIVAVSDTLRSSGRVTVDLTRAGATVAATIVLASIGSVSGTVLHPDGATPAAGAAVYVFRSGEGGYEILGSATTNAQGGYRIDGIRSGAYQVSSFNATFSEGNIVPAVVSHHGQVFRADITWRGGGGKVVGTVYADDGQTPLKALVSISGDQLQIAGGRVGVRFQYVSHYRIAETDFTTGAFALSGAWVGPVTVSAAGQFSPDPIAVTATIPSSNATVQVDLRLQPTSQIRGVVLQPNGVNPAGANLIVKYKSEAFKVICTTNSLTGEDECTSIPQGIQEEIVVTDVDGRFWLPIVNAGPFTVSVEDPVTGKVGQVKGAVRAGEEADLSVRLLGLGELAVQVFGSDTSTPIPGARVVVTQLNHPRKEVQGQADTAGRIVFVGADGFSEGEFAIVATDLRNGFAGRGTARISRDGEQVSVNVYLFDSAGAVSGRIFTTNGITPVPNAEIVLSNSAGPLAFALSGVDGSYRVETVPIGDFRIEAFEARTARRAAATGRVDLAGQEVPVNLTQAALGVVKGHLSESSTLAPLKGWTINLGQRSASGLALGSLQTTSALDGGYLFPGTAQGTFTVTAHKSGVQGSASASGTIDYEGETVDVPLLVKLLRPLTGTISGTVVTPSGDPAPNSPVEICHPLRSCESPLQLTADASGRFSLPDVPLGRYQVTARSQVTREAGTMQGELSFDGDIASVVVVLGGVSEVRGTVERSNGTPAAGIAVTLVGLPDAGCAGSCVVFTDAAGAFAFADVPASMFTVTAVDPLNTQLKGSAGGALHPGQVAQVRIVLTPTFVVTGRAVLPGNVPAAHIVAQLITSIDPDRRLFVESGADGAFTFPAVPPGTHPLLLSDPIGSGVASRSIGVSADVSLGDVVLDTAAPSVVTSDPANAATAVPLNAAIRVTFSEPVRPGTIAPDTVSLSGPAGALLATLDLTENDTILTVTPLAPLAHETRYTLRILGIEDRFGKVMAGNYVATFTTVDITPPAFVSTSPAADTGGAPVASAIRIRFSETIDVARFTGAAIVLAGPAGPVAGRTDYLFANTVVVFTPNMPLAEDSQYLVTVARAFDLAGNSQAAALSYAFTTTDRTPPQIASLTAAGGGLVVENGTTSVVADVGATHDVGIVDWYINDTLVFADRAAPFELAFRADSALYGPAGSVIRIAAIATDTSGNRGSPAETQITVTADQPPAVTILLPANGLSARTGDRIVVRVRGTDDLGVTRIGYRAGTGNPADAITRPVTPTALDRLEEFAFYIPATAVPGTTIAVHASASDTRAQVAEASIDITVLDAMPPVVTITGATSGARVFPGQQTTVVVTAQDIGRIASVSFAASGLLTHAETRPVDPAAPSIVTSFTVTVPVTARAGQTLILGATATDVAGNSASAAQVVLPVADSTPPTIVLAPQSGSFDAVPGRSVDVVATAEDEIGVARIDLTASGGGTHAESKQVSPPVGSAAIVFSVPVPADAVAGTQIQVSATATDVANNTSGPASLTLTIISPVQVTLPASAIVDAGATVDVNVQLSGPAPTGGVRIDFATDQSDVATASPFVVVAEGQTSATVTLAGVAGGSTQIRALSGGVTRASMTVTVRGGIVSGIVRDSQFNPVAGAQLTVSGGSTQQNVVTDGAGHYSIDGVPGPDVSVRALDPVTKLYGHASSVMAHRLGYAVVNVVLIPAAAVHGTVADAAGAAVGAGVRVDIFTRTGFDSLGTVFTAADGSYSFPLVTLGDYRIEAAAADGRRARSTVLLGESGQDALVNLVYLGTGTVSGTVRLGASAVPNARLTLYSWSIFGSAPEVQGSAAADGTFSFPNVALGGFSIVAHDDATGQAGSASGSVAQHGQTVAANVQLSTYGAIEGRILRSDGITPVAGATVRLGTVRETTTGADGSYRFDIVPLNTYSIEAEEPSTRGYSSGTVSVAVHGTTYTVDLAFLPQARLAVTVTNPGGATVPGAFVYVLSELGGRRTSVSTQTGGDGTALVDQLLAGTFSVYVSYGAQRGQAAGTLMPGELKPIAIELTPTGSIAGTIFEADGQTPAASARVVVVGVVSPVITGVDGTFRFDALALGSYSFTVYDSAGRLRARSFDSGTGTHPVITSNGEVVARDFTFIGLGTVTGRVINPDGSSAQNMPVQVRAGAAGFQSTRGAQTDGGGFYTFEHVPIGDVTIVASDLARQLYGERTGVIDRHDGSVQLDVALTSNAIALPRTIYDANNLAYDVQPEGSLRNGNGFFYGNGADELGALWLDVTSGGTTTRFTGPEVPTIEDGGREVAVRQENLAGLSVTRKVFVPRAGYFARYLEIFRNPTTAPITIDVDLTSFPTTVDMALTRTSSGDAAFALDDNWIVTSQAPGASAALLFQADGATARIATGSFEERYAYYYQQWARATYGWRSITIGPGETVALMHFGVQQLSRAAAIASVERLAQLPPEALSGLSPEESGAVRNFTMPGGGVSALAPLPALTGRVTGRVLEHDATTAVPYAAVRFTSGLVFFGREQWVSANAEGAFDFTGVLADGGGSLPIPVTAFTLSGRHSGSYILSPTVAGTIQSAAVPAVSDIVFTNTAMVTGVVRRHDGTAVQGGNVYLVGPNVNMQAPIGHDAAYRFTGVPAGTLQMTAYVGHPQGTALSVTQAVQIVAGQVQDVSITLPPTGSVTGTVRTASGLPVPSAQMFLTQGASFYRYATTDSGGVFTLTDLPEGPVSLTVTDPRTTLQVTAPATVVRDAAAIADFTLQPVGSVSIQVNLSSGQPAPQSLVYLSNLRSAYTDGIGLVVFDNVPTGSYTITASHPANSSLSASTQVTVSDEGVAVPVTMTLPAAGLVVVTVTRGAGVLVAGSQVRLSQAGRSDQYRTTDSAGRVTFTAVGSGAFTARADHPANRSLAASVAGAIATEGETLSLAVVLPPIGAVTGTVRLGTNPVGGVVVSARSTSGAIGTLTTTTDASGVYTINGIPGGSFTVTVEDFTRQVYGLGTGQIATDLQTVVVDISLVNNVVPLGTNLNDGNGFLWDIQRSGEISDGSSDAYDGGLNLRLRQGTSSVLFGGASSGLTEEAGREIAIRQVGIYGLDVTRKIYVPLDGYFARFLEVLSNPGTAPITVDVAVESNLGSDSSTTTVATSSGDTTFAPDDLWILTDDRDSGGDPSLMHVVGGASAATVLSVATRSGDSLQYRWNSITIQPGGTVILMHFAAQHFTQAQVRAAGERLVQLPPEAIAGLSAEEIAAISNFAVPADGSSPLTEVRKPGIGTVNGRVYGPDGVTPVAGVRVEVASANLLFGNRSAANVDAAGQFTIANVPIDAFSVTAYFSSQALYSPAVAGTFEAGQVTATADVAFTNGGTVRGSIRTSAGDVFAVTGSLHTPYSVPVTAGDYVFPLVAPGAVTLRGNIPLPQGGTVPVIATGTVVAGQVTTLDTPLPPLGRVTGTITTAAGLPAANVRVLLNDQYYFGQEVLTGPAGEYTFTHAPAGWIRIGAVHPGTDLPVFAVVTVAADQTHVVDLTLDGAGSVSGTISNPDGSPTVGTTVELRDSTYYFQRTTTTDAAGQYSFASAPSGALTLRAYAQGFNGSIYREVNVPGPPDGGAITVNVTVQAVATVRVLILDATGAPLSGGGVYYRPTNSYYDQYYGSTNSQGYLDLTVPEGPYEVSTYFYPSGLQVRQYGNVLPADHGRTIVHTFRNRAQGTVSGIVYAGDGQTRVPYPWVNIFEGDVHAGTVYGNDLGEYNSGVIWLPSGDFTLRANAGQVSVSSPASMAADGTSIVRDFTMPLAVIKGTVTFADGAPVLYPDVFATTTTIDGQTTTYYASLNGPAGEYVILAPAGTYEVMARTNIGLTARGAAVVADVSSVVVVDLQMPATGTVTGVLRRASGLVAPWERIWLTTAGLEWPIDRDADQSGQFSFAGIPLGRFNVQACLWESPITYCETVTGELTSAGQIVTADITMAPLGSLSVRVVDAAGNLAPWADVEIGGIARHVEAQQYSQNPAVFAVLPEGTVSVLAQGPNAEYGIAEATIFAGRQTDVEVRLGSAVRPYGDFTGAAGFVFDVDCDGSVYGGNHYANGWSTIYVPASELNVNGVRFPCRPAGVSEENGRELILGPAIPGANNSYNAKPTALATRKVFSPPSGAFLRYYDQVTNTSAYTQTFTVLLSGNYGDYSSTSVVAVTPGSTSNTYAVLTAGASTTAPATALVFAGAGAPNAPVVSIPGGSNREYTYRWSVTLAAGQTAALLHYIVPAAPGDVAGAQARAQALAALTDPDALQGLSPAEQALVINFAGGAASSVRQATVEGTVVAGDGVTPVPAAKIYVLDGGNGRVVASGSADGMGTFRLQGFSVSGADVQVIATYAGAADRIATQVVAIATDGQIVSGLVLTLPMAVLGGTISDATGLPVAGAFVLASRVDGFDTYRTTSLPGGRYGFIGLPSGVYTIVAVDAAATVSGAGTIAIADAGAALDIALPPLAVCTPPPSSLAAWWPGEGDPSNAVQLGASATPNGIAGYVPSKVGQGFSFTGGIGSADLPVGTALDNAFTIESWVTLRSAGPRWIASRIVAGGWDFGLLTSDDAVPRLRVLMTLSTGQMEFTSQRVLDLNRAYHVAVSLDGQHVRLYIDGELDTAQAAAGARFAAAAPLRLGSPDDVAEACDCIVDEVKVYDRALGGADVQATYGSLGAGVCTDLWMLGTVLPAAVEGQPYSATLRASGGIGPVTFAIDAGAVAPGLTLDASGAISGTPTAQGVYSFTATVTDAAGASSSAAFTQDCGACLASPADAIAYWSADGNAIDTIGAHDGTLSGIDYVSGIQGRAFNFSGSDTLVPTTPRLEVSDNFTIEFWARPSVQRYTAWEATNGIYGTAGWEQRYAIAPEYRGVDGQANVGVSVGTNGVSVFEHGPGYLPALLVYNTPITGWTHIAVVYRNKQPSLYLNGVLVRTGLTSTRTVYLSKQMGDFNGYGYYQGLLDEVALYSRPLSDAEISAIALASIKQRCR